MKNISIMSGVKELVSIKATLLLAVLVALLFTQNIAQAAFEVGADGGVSGEVRMETGVRADAEAEAVFCTADAYQCPDGEWVGRTGPNCEFVCSDDSEDGEDVEETEDRNNNTEMSSIAAARLAGLDIDVRDEDSDDDGLDDGTESEVSGNTGVEVKVNGVTVRGWDAETKSAVKARLAVADTQNNANDFGLFVAMQAIDHKEIKDIKVEGDGKTIVSFEADLKLLGFIPLKATAKATAQSNGEVKTSYPWWSFLAGKAESENVSVFSTIAADIATRTTVE